MGWSWLLGLVLATLPRSKREGQARGGTLSLGSCKGRDGGVRHFLGKSRGVWGTSVWAWEADSGVGLLGGCCLWVRESSWGGRGLKLEREQEGKGKQQVRRAPQKDGRGATREASSRGQRAALLPGWLQGLGWKGAWCSAGTRRVSPGWEGERCGKDSQQGSLSLPLPPP